jgi:hypothetical protein
MNLAAQIVVVSFVLGLHGASHAQGTQLDSVYWGDIMSERTKEILQLPLYQYEVKVNSRIDQSKPIEIRINTVDSALTLLADPKINSKDVFRLYDFLDSAANYFYKTGTPVFLMSGDACTQETEMLMMKEKELGVQYVYTYRSCVIERGERDGETLFNLKN